MRTQHDDPDRVAHAARAPSSKARAVDAGVLVGGAGPRKVDLGPGGLLRLQRFAGNAAVARRLGGQRSRAAIQRSKESEELLTKLATPKVGEGQATGVQTELVDTLEQLINRKTWPHDIVPDELTLGGVLIDRLPDADKTYMPSGDKQQRRGDVQGLFEHLALGGHNPFAPAVFVGLDKVNDPKGAKLGARFGAEVKQAGLGPKLVENTLKTMLDAGQFEYFRLAGLPNQDWKILVEVHYIRARPKDMAGFHKDTQGESIFVNLNYHVPGERLRGPEYVLNPPRSEAHDKQIYGTPEKKGTLPEGFTKDLTEIRKALPEPTRIESAGTIEALGYVAFVDEAVHHATPWFGGRYVTPSEFKAYLERKVNADKAYQDWRDRKPKKGGYSQLLSEDERSDLASFSKYVNEKEKVKAKQTKAGYSKLEDERGDSASFSKVVNKKKWKRWLAMASVEESRKAKYERVTRYTREDFAGTMQGIEFDLMLEDVGMHHTDTEDRRKGGAAGWYAASIPEAGLSPVKPTDQLPLVRTASDRDLTKQWPKQLPEDVPRKFIRSWVRAVPKSFADGLRGS